MKIPQPRTVPDIVRQFYSVISRPVCYASLFYTYYYLVEVENIRELRRDFEKIRDELYVAFYNYGIYSVGTELMWATEAIRIPYKKRKGDYTYAEARYILNSEHAEVYPEFYEEFKRQDVNPRDISRYMRYIQTSYDEHFNDTVGTDVDYETVEDICIWLQNKFSIFTNKTMLIDAERMFLLKNWTFGGGEPWSKIARTLLRRNKTKPTVFVDACWGMQHVTGSWLDRVKVPGEESYATIYNTVSKILEWKSEGEMPRVFRYALDYEPSLIKYARYVK